MILGFFALLVGAAAGFVLGWVARFHMERDTLPTWREERAQRNLRDEIAVFRWLSENGQATDDTLIQQLDVPAGRVRNALERLEHRRAIRGGYPSLEQPDVLMYWREYQETGGDCYRFCGRSDCMTGCQRLAEANEREFMEEARHDADS